MSAEEWLSLVEGSCPGSSKRCVCTARGFKSPLLRQLTPRP